MRYVEGPVLRGIVSSGIAIIAVVVFIIGISAAVAIAVVAGAFDTTITVSSTTTVTTTLILTQTERTTLTTTNPAPKNVTLDGILSTTGVGTNPAKVHFTSERTGIEYPGNTSGDSYFVNLPNGDIYKVQIEFTNPVGPNGSCSAGALVLGVQVESQTPIEIGWSC